MNGKIHGKQVRDNSISLVKLDLSGSQGTFLFGTGSYLGAYDVPDIPQAFVTKQYADSISSGLDPKESVYLVATDNIPSLFGTQSIDGVTASIGSRVLLTNQTSSVDNGIYIVKEGTWSRATDSDGDPGSEVSVGNYTFVERGVSYSSTGWVLYDTNSTGPTISVGVHTQLWTQFSGAGSFIWGDGISNTANNIYIDLDPNSGLTFSTGRLKIADYAAGGGLTITDGILNIGAGDGITVNADTVDINYTEAATGLRGNGLTASGGKINVGAGDGITVSSDSIAVDYSTVAIALAGNGLSASGTKIDVNVSNGLTVSGDFIQIDPGAAGNALSFSSGVFSVNVLKGVTISGDALFADASTILTTENLPSIDIGTNSTIQSALNAIDNKLSSIGLQEMVSISNSVTGVFLSSVSIPQDVLGVTFSIPSDGPPSIFINGAYVKPRSATTSNIAYFSTDGGTTGTETVQVGSRLYINVNQLGYNLDDADVITLHYLSRLI